MTPATAQTSKDRDIDVPLHPARDPERDAELRSNNPRIFLKALLAGRTVTLDGRTYKLFRPEQDIETSFGTRWVEKPTIMVRGMLVRGGIEKEIWLGAELDLAEFVILAEKEPFEVGFILAAEMALSEDAASRRKDRTERLKARFNRDPE